jgi:hypothetical protein
VYDQVLAVIQTAGSKGCTLDDLAAALPWHEKISISPVPARLKEQGIVYETGTTRTGKSGRQQIVHVAYLPGEQVSIPAIVQRARQHTAKDPIPAPSADVLAVMERSAETIRFLAEKSGVCHPATDLIDARDAVQKLIEAACKASATLGHAYHTELTGQLAEHAHDDYQRLDTALANCKPEGG